MMIEPVLILGDCIEVMRGMPEASVDAIVTDPPYGLGFMGREWDTFSPEVVAAAAARRQRKGTRDTSTVYASKRGEHQGGGPNVSYDESTRGNRAFQAWCEAWAIEALRVLKPGGHAVVFGGPRTFHRLTCGLEDAGFEIRDVLSWLFGSGFPKSRNDTAEVLGDATWEGWGTALKPAWEPAVLARKPLIGTIAQNVAAHGAGLLNIGGCRLETSDDLNGGGYSAGAGDRHDGDESWRMKNGAAGDYRPPSGRWPANVMLDAAAAALLDEQTGATGGGDQATGPSRESGTNWNNTHGTFNGTDEPAPFYGDSGGPSRFYYTAKASRSEREAGLDGVAPVRRGDGRAAIDGPGANNPRQRSSERRNDHPTVKPLALMRWLVTLVTPPAGIVLDPFMGSGTTGVAALELGFEFIGIDREERYLEIARRRMAHERPMRMVL